MSFRVSLKQGMALRTSNEYYRPKLIEKKKSFKILTSPQDISDLKKLSSQLNRSSA